MLTLLSLLSLLMPLSGLHFLFLLCPIFVYYLINLNYFMNESLYMVSSLFLHDELSLFMNLLLFFIIYVSFISAYSFKSFFKMNLVLMMLLLVCYQVFVSNNALLLYFFYEASLIPILYIIIKWGSYPERSLSAMMLLIYTSIFSAPVLIMLLQIFHTNNTFTLSVMNVHSISNSLLFSVLIFLCFAVKLPIYGLHYWLPMAHVEAPTFGSIILASLLLKLGGVGLIRFMNLMDISALKNLMLSYFILFTLLSTLVCCYQSDFKRLIAYSSVSHMMLIPFMILSNNIMAMQSLIMLMLFHGLSSTLLFSSVGFLYSVFSTRQLVLMRGLVLITPLFSFLMISTFFFTLPAPPFPSFIMEAFFMMSSYGLSYFMIGLYLLYSFFGLVYNLNWLTSILFASSSSTNYTSSNLPYSVFMYQTLIFLLTFMFIIVFYCFLSIAYEHAYVSTFQVHFVWFLSLFFLTLIFLLLSLLSNSLSLEWLLSFDLFTTSSMKMQCVFILDWMSLSFLTVVLMISSIIMIYSYNYMMPYNKSYYFLILTLLFVLSMSLLVTSYNFLFMMLGWDGLGLISFFLIIFYQSEVAITSGSFTLMMNRLGDCLFLVSIVLMFTYSPSLNISMTSNFSFLLSFFLILTCMTKSAIYPFSPWLPKAMAAPTPISALVHSSTLVTAGLFIMMRYSYLLYSSQILMNLLLLTCIFTSFYAGVNSLFEMDIKRLVALSTLSHLGFIGMAFSLGLLHLSFFHMMTHALFKSLLFMAMGDVFINIHHSQDLRYLSSGLQMTPISSLLINISTFSLLGVPFVSGFYSKDLVLEHLNYSNISVFILIMVYINVFLTYMYSFKIFTFSFSKSKMSPYVLLHETLKLHNSCLVFLALMSVLGGYFYMTYVNMFILSLPNFGSLKFLPLFISLSVFIFLVLFISFPIYKSKLTNFFSSSMFFLSDICMNFFSNTYHNNMFSIVKSVELGFINYSLNNQIPNSIVNMKNMVYSSLFNVFNTTLLFSSFAILMFILSLFL